MKNVLKWMIAICGCLLFVLCVSTNTYAENYSIATDDSWVSGEAEEGEANYYIFTIPSAGKVTITYQSYEALGRCNLYDRDLAQCYGAMLERGSATNPATGQFSKNLEPGTYQLKLFSGSTDGHPTKYRMKVSYTPANNNETEPNNAFATAMPLAGGQQVKGFISINDKLDFYKFTIHSQMTVRITVDTTLDNALPGYKLTVWNSDLIEEKKDKDISNGTVYIWEKSIGPGTYYIKIEPGHSFDVGDYTGLYTLKWDGLNRVSSIQLKNTSITLAKGKTYNLLESVFPAAATNKNLSWISDNQSVAAVNSGGKITAKNVGVATITATAQDGSEVSASCQVIVKPAKTVIKSCKRAADRNVTVKVQKQKNVSGIQYQLSRKRNFKGKTSSYYAGSTQTTATTAALSRNKTYYFRARMYIDYGGKRYYGDWSKVKRIKTKARSYKRGYYSWRNV